LQKGGLCILGDIVSDYKARRALPSGTGTPVKMAFSIA
jgi:hypothetical protein